MNRIPMKNKDLSASEAFLVYPEVTEEIDLVQDGIRYTNDPRFSRRLAVMGAIAEGTTCILCVTRGDNVEVPIPFPSNAIGREFNLALRALLPYTVTAVRHTGDGPTVTLTGTPAGNYEIAIEITTSGALDTGEFRWSLDGGTTWEEETVTLPAGGTDALGSTGLTANFAVGDYVDGDLYEAESFVTDATNVLVEW